VPIQPDPPAPATTPVVRAPVREDGSDGPSAALLVLPGAVAVLDPVMPFAPPRREEPPANLPSTLDVGTAVPPGLAVRPRSPAEAAPIRLAAAPVPIAVMGASRERSLERAADGGGTATPPGRPASGAVPAAADPCGGQRQLVEERCEVATAARDQAKTAADTLRNAQREYDALRERVERAQADADPRAIVAAKDSLHKQFRIASAMSVGAEDTEAAAREWLQQINLVNTRSRDAQRIVESGAAELRAALPRLDRLTVEADAARIAAESAEAGCHEARERLASCEEAQVTARAAAPPPAAPVAPTTGPGGDELPGPPDWANEPSTPLLATPLGQASLEAVPAIVRILRGDRAAREHVVAGMAAGDPEATREWHLHLAQLVDAISARAIEDGYLDLPESDAFWGLFAVRETREIVGALSALGFRFDGLGGFADERVPAPRDLSLAVGYAGLDRMRIRAWPREQDLPGLYAQATVAADEWLAHEAGDLSLGEMVDALGARAGELADVWNAWGRLRPLLLAGD